jgi:hypothetical protein
MLDRHGICAALNRVAFEYFDAANSLRRKANYQLALAILEETVTGNRHCSLVIWKCPRRRPTNYTSLSNVDPVFTVVKQYKFFRFVGHIRIV